MYSKKKKSCICETQRCQIQSLKTKSTVTSTTFSKGGEEEKAATKIMDYFYTQCQDQNFPSHSYHPSILQPHHSYFIKNQTPWSKRQLLKTNKHTKKFVKILCSRFIEIVSRFWV